MGSDRFFDTEREIGIDAGHRVALHESKCHNLHGHRYRVIATVTGPLQEEGAQSGMTLDFSFIKQLMMQEIDSPCDHGLIYDFHDPLMWGLFCPCISRAEFDEAFVNDGFVSSVSTNGMKVYVVPFTPTAENLAKHWFDRMESKVQALSKGLASLRKVTVYETPNCVAVYPSK